MIVRPEADEDRAAVDAVHERAFGGDKRIGRLVGALRSTPAGLPPRGFVADDGGVVGHVLLSAGRLDAPARLVDVYVLSPLGVLPHHQRRGIGTALIARALSEADQSGVPLLFLEGDPGYYRARGFAPASPLGFRSPSLRIPDPAFQVVRLAAHEPWMTGTLVYSDPFWAHDCVGLRP